MSYIICFRQEDSNSSGVIIVEGSTLTNCCECDKPVWISPASVGVMLEGNATPLCLYCASDMPPDKGINPPNAEQLKEVIRELKKELKIENPTDRFKK